MTVSMGIERTGFEAFAQLTSIETQPTDWPLASSVRHRVPVYDGEMVREAASSPSTRRALLAEWAMLLESGPGVFAIERALPDRAVLDEATRTFTEMIEAQHRSGASAGDHFAKPGANDRIWNAFEKHALADPDNFVRYFGSPVIALAAEAWLGPGYQMTTQVNCVNPGGAAQVAHRDFHLGFMSPAQAERFPSVAHRLSPSLTLQGAVAHCDMPVETGPTMYLPYSQMLHDGYVVFGQAEYQEVFASRYVQLPLLAGDAVFFNPALMHGAGHNRTIDVKRMANLLQVSSAFGRPMEVVDRDAVVLRILPALRSAIAAGMDKWSVDAVVASIADGYAFPTNLDRDPPVNGLAPASHADIVRQAVAESWPEQRVNDALCAYRSRR